MIRKVAAIEAHSTTATVKGTSALAPKWPAARWLTAQSGLVGIDQRVFDGL